ncbi:glycoside hydrolase family 13 protein [Alkalibacterium olivapovliticus]|uniref:Alpha-amylase n=1 Tax=Alkalibacterium olivapovliticus TaxID=99907 RepID=A0A2T0W8X3_9LACT|nr:alpha-glucosidase [Alkalibacterium olivapovliticus]PRY83158.1 oligo-1,6-glucosidase/alpha-glucosidase [Alkalibacterium olivapovliticus]
MEKQWWKKAVAYQIYPRSFYDSNGDGIGDLRGIIEKLDYIKELGIDVIWVSPVYESPNDDNGYDISDYHDIMSEFGTMADFDELLDEVHNRGMKIIMDLVINHTSDEHEWFIESRSSKDNPYRDFYIWHPSKADGSEINNWESIFGGSVWEYDETTDEYFMHVFSKKQPDLNWENATVREHLYEMVNWWLDKGIDGFRVDAISHIKKRNGFPNMPNPLNKDYVPSFDGHMNQPGIDLFLSEFAEKTIKNYDVMTVGEANGVSIKDADRWVGEENGYFNMIFQFEHLGLWGANGEGLDLKELKEVMTRWQKGLDGRGWNALFIENHDLARSVSTWGNDADLRKTSAKALATFYFFMQGTPFIYQGQEIGMTNVQFDSIDDYDDVGMINMYNIETKNGSTHDEIMEYIWKNGRDNSRTPMQWSNAPEAGFTTGTPWFGTNPNYPDINVEQAVNDPDSIYHFYKKMIQMRKTTPVLIYGHYELIADEHETVYAYLRAYEGVEYVVMVNMFNSSTVLDLSKELDLGELKLSNYTVTDELNPVIKLRPYEARVYKVAKQKVWHDPNYYTLP